MSHEITLYDHPMSSYAQKVRIALREKSIPFNSVVPEGIGSGAHNAEFFATNPRKEVPCLIVGSGAAPFRIFDSTVILAYLEDKYEPALLPPASEAEARAKARMIEEVCDTAYEAINWGYMEVMFFGRGEEQGVAEKLKERALLQTKTVLEWLSGQLGKQNYFCGEQYGYADVCVGPVLNRSVYYGIGPEKESSLWKWHERVQQRGIVQETYAEMEKTANALSKSAKGLIKQGGWRREYRDHRLEWMLKSGGLEIVMDGLEQDNIRFGWPHTTRGD